MRLTFFSFVCFACLLSSCATPVAPPEALRENAAPTVTILRPADNSVTSVDAPVEVLAEAADPDGRVEEVAFFVNGEEVGTSNSAPYTYVFAAAASGEHTLAVRAYDDTGANATESVTVEVDAVQPEPPARTFAVMVAVLGDGTVSSTPPGIACPGTCAQDFAVGQAVELAAEATAGSSFAGWEGDCSGQGCRVSADAQLSATFETTEEPDAEKPFTLVALPDTQNYVCYGADGDGCGGKSERFPGLFEAQTQWVVDNLDTENIVFVTHEGDMVDNALVEAEWLDGDRAMDTLDGKVPYSVAIGDHDYGPEEYHDGDTTFYRSYFGAERYQGYDWYGGAAPNGLSHYQLFTVGGHTFLHIALEWEAPGSAKTWAKSVLEAHPDLPTILTTHAYLRDGDTSGRSTFTQSCFQPGNPAGTKECPGAKEGTQNPDASSGQDIFDGLVYPYPQVFMVLGGHFHYNGRRESSCTAGYLECDNGEYRQVSLNSAGSEVYEMLANYQDYANGGDGWLRLIRFLPGGGEDNLDRIEVKTYSPVLDSYQSGDASDFFYDLSFAERFGSEQ